MADRSNVSKSAALPRAATKAPSAAAARRPAGGALIASGAAAEPGYSCAICSTNVPARTGTESDADAAPIAAAHRYRPFCSARCQRIDLGNWLDERYVVPGGPAATEAADAAAEADEA